MRRARRNSGEAGGDDPPVAGRLAASASAQPGCSAFTGSCGERGDTLSLISRMQLRAFGDIICEFLLGSERDTNQIGVVR